LAVLIRGIQAKRNASIPNLQIEKVTSREWPREEIMPNQLQISLFTLSSSLYSKYWDFWTRMGKRTFIRSEPFPH
jgi:hypothetical protein